MIFMRISIKNFSYSTLFSQIKFLKIPASAFRKWLLSIVAVLALVLGCLVTPRSASALRPSAGAPASTLSALPDPQPARVGKREAKEVAVSPDGRTLAVAASTGLYFYDTTSLAEVRFIPTDAVIWLWDGQSGKQVRALEGHADWVRGIAFSPESRLLASGSRDGTVRLWGVLR